MFIGKIHLNADKQEKFPDIRDHWQEIGQALIDECENDERLRVPAVKLEEGLRNFLEGGDLTGAALFHLAGYHLFWFKEDQEHPGQFSLLLDIRLKNTIPDAEDYFKRFLKILRTYNADPAPAVSGPALIFRAVDIPDIFEDRGPCLAEPDELEEESRQEIIRRLMGTLQAVTAQNTGKSPAPARPAPKAAKPPKPAAGKRDLGRFAGADGRLDAFMAVAFFTKAVIFFHPEDLLWDGKYPQFRQLPLQCRGSPRGRGRPGAQRGYFGGLEGSDPGAGGKSGAVGSRRGSPPGDAPLPQGGGLHSGGGVLHGVFPLLPLLGGGAGQIRIHVGGAAGPFLLQRLSKNFDYPYFEKFIGALRAYNGNRKPYKAVCNGTFGGEEGPHLPKPNVSQYEHDEEGCLKRESDGDFEKSMRPGTR